ANRAIAIANYANETTTLRSASGASPSCRPAAGTTLLSNSRLQVRWGPRRSPPSRLQSRIQRMRSWPPRPSQIFPAAVRWTIRSCRPSEAQQVPGDWCLSAFSPYQTAPLSPIAIYGTNYFAGQMNLQIQNFDNKGSDSGTINLNTCQ